MPLSAEERKYYYDILNKTRGHRETAVKDKIVPEEYRTYWEYQIIRTDKFI